MAHTCDCKHWLAINAKALTLLFLLVSLTFALLISFIYADGRIVAWSADAQWLYLNFLAYEGDVLRSIVKSIFDGSMPVVPMYNFNLGYGADTFVTMGGMLNDPLNLFAVCFSADNTEILYAVLCWVRLELAAFAFYYYCVRRGKSQYASIVGALCFITCGFALFWGLYRHPHFLNTIILLPLILAGADKLFEGKNPALYIASLAMQFFVSVYFCYMTCLILVGYALIKFLFSGYERTPRKLLTLLAKFVGFSLIGFGMAAVAALPIVMNLTSMGRIGVEHYVPMLNTVGFYLDYPAWLIGGIGTEMEGYIGAVGIISSMVILLAGRYYDARERRCWLIGAFCLLVCWAFPYFGHVFNGFSYATNRWIYATGFVVAYLVVLAVPVFAKITQNEWKKIGIGILLFAVAALVPILNEHRMTAVVSSFILIVVCVTLALGAKKMHEKTLAASLSAFVIIPSFVACCLFCSSHGDDYLQEFLERDSSTETYFVNNPLAIATEINYSEPYRVSRSDKLGLRNASLLIDVKAIDFYSSFYNQYVDDFRKELGISDHSASHIFVGSDSRFAADMLTGAKYFVGQRENYWDVPWGYEEIDANDQFVLYSSEYAVPIAFSTASVIDAESYNLSSPEDKQTALLQGVVLSDNNGNSPIVNKPLATSIPVQYSIDASSSVRINDDNTFNISKEGECLNISFEGIPQCELYLVIEGFDFRAVPIWEREGERFRKAWLFWSYPGNNSFSLASGDRIENYSNLTVYSSQYSGKEDWVLNLGYFEEAPNEMTLTLKRIGKYSFEDMRVVCQPMEPMAAQARKLAMGGSDSLTMQDNRIEASFSVGNDIEYAVFTVPYSKGWSATVDGHPADVLRADTAFMAVELDGPGTHVVELKYVTPGLVPGAFISIIGIMLFIVVCAVHKRRVR